MLLCPFMRTRKYSGNGLNTKSNGQGITKLVELSRRRWGAESLGIFVNRPKRGKPSELSVHALWRAADLRFGCDEDRNEAAAWFVKYNHDLKVDLIVDYAWTKRDKLGRKAYGRSWKCDTQRWMNHKKGDLEGGGETWANWLHIELGAGYVSTESGVIFEKLWRQLPKP